MVVASMLTYAVQCASEAEEDSPADRLLEAAEADIEDAPRLLKPMLVGLFRFKAPPESHIAGGQF